MDDAEKAARIIELEMERTGLALAVQKLLDDLHDKKNRLQVVTLRIAQLQRGIDER